MKPNRGRPCRFCGVDLIFARNVKSGKIIPLEKGSEETAVRFVLVDDPIRRDDVELRCESRSVRGLVSHFANCPNADEARRKD